MTDEKQYQPTVKTEETTETLTSKGNSGSGTSAADAA
jgi:hypothetical protein